MKASKQNNTASKETSFTIHELLLGYFCLQKTDENQTFTPPLLHRMHALLAWIQGMSMKLSTQCIKVCALANSNN